MIDKIAYSKKRRGCTLFYVDSNVFTYEPAGTESTAGGGATMLVGVFEKVFKAFPDCLLIPEHKYDHYYKNTVPYNQWNF